MAHKLPRLFEGAPDEGRHWLEAVRHYTVDDAFRARAVERAAQVFDAMDAQERADQAMSVAHQL